MAKLTHEEIDRQVERAMMSPSTIGIERFQEYLDKRGAEALPEPKLPKLLQPPETAEPEIAEAA